MLVIRLDDETFYDENTLRVMGLDEDVLKRARRDGRLRYKNLGGIRMYKGAWVRAWLDQAEPVANVNGGVA